MEKLVKDKHVEDNHETEKDLVEENNVDRDNTKEKHIQQVHNKKEADVKEDHLDEDHAKEKRAVEGYVSDRVQDVNDKENTAKDDLVADHAEEDNYNFLNKYRVTTIPLTAYYIPEFITESEERALISSIYCAPKPKWEQLLKRRLQNWGGLPTMKGMICEAMPHWLMQYLNRIDALDIMNGNKPNHVLINEYLPGQGIMPHKDGFLFYATISTISLKSPTVLKFQEPRNDDSEKSPHVFSLLLEPRSLLILKDSLFNDYLHSIEELTEDKLDDTIANLKMVSSEYVKGAVIPRDTRLSLTIRNVPRARNYRLGLRQEITY